MADMVLELRRAASGTLIKVSELLLKAWGVATKLNVIDQEPWILSELEGYSDVEPKFFPSYRFLGDDIKCYSESYPGTFVAIPSMFSKAGYDFYEQHLLRPLYGISVYEIERLLKYCTKDAEVDLLCPQCVEAAVNKLTGVPLPITLVFQEYSLTGILDAVRKKIFDWALNLEENGISGEEPPAQTDAGESQKPTKKRTYNQWPITVQKKVAELWVAFRRQGQEDLWQKQGERQKQMREIDCYNYHKENTALLPDCIKSVEDFKKCKECAKKNGFIPPLRKKRGKNKGKLCQ